MIRGMHKGAEHVGKVPQGLVFEQQRRERLADLRGRLDIAIHEEQYEIAAYLRDEIRQLETEAATAGDGR